MLKGAHSVSVEQALSTIRLCVCKISTGGRSSILPDTNEGNKNIVNHLTVFPESLVPFSRSHRTTNMPQGLLQGLPTVQRHGQAARALSWKKRLGVPILGIGLFVAMAPLAMGSHRGSDDHQVASETGAEETGGHSIPGVSFQVFLHEGKGAVKDESQGQVRANAALQTVVEAFGHMIEHQTDYARFHEALTKEALHQVIIEPKVVNREGKEFLLLVVRTSRPGQGNLLMSASALEEQGYLNRPEQLVPFWPENSNGW
jgi:hypothetical protein